MNLLLLRHADAETEAVTDHARRLSEKGEAQARKVARFLEANEITPELVLASPLRRAQETARIVSDHLRVELLTVAWAASGLDPETGLDELRAYAKFDCVMLVGHEPDFSMLAAHLLGLRDPAQLRIRKASLTHLELTAFAPGAARLDWSIPCRLM